MLHVYVSIIAMLTTKIVFIRFNFIVKQVYVFVNTFFMHVLVWTYHFLLHYRYDPDASGTINGEKFMNKLGITFSNGVDNGRLSPILESGMCCFLSFSFLLSPSRQF